MRGYKFRKVKTIFLTVFSVSFCFVVFLNVMVVELNSPENEKKETLVEYSMHRRLSQDQKLKDSENSAIFDNSQNVKIIERKPQAMIDDNVSQKLNKVLYNPVQYITKNQKHSIEMDYKISQLKKLVKTKLKDVLNYEYESDIDKAVIEDNSDEDDDYEDSNETDKNQNKVFKFDKFLKQNKNIAFSKPKLKFKEVPQYVESVTNTMTNKTDDNKQVTKKLVITNIVEDGIYWSKEVEELIPKGLTEVQLNKWIKNIRHQPVKHLQIPTWNKCGRAKNRYVILEDGTALCGRYRHPHNKLVSGEVLSFYLSKLLSMDNIPAVVLSKLNQTSPQWRNHDLAKADWEEGQFVALIQWVPHMESRISYVYMPKQILEALESKTVIDAVSLGDNHLSSTVLSDLVQWGTMIIFDYLTGNYDRVGSMQDSAYREKNPAILKENIRNLRTSTKTSKLWLIDNESGLLDAYDLLYRGGENGKQFITFHRQMLQTMCIFEKPLVKALESLHRTPEPHKTLEHFARQREPYLDQVEKDNSYNLFKSMFSKRLKDVFEWIQYCQSGKL